MNKVILIGNVGKDPVSATGNAKGAHFTLATSEKWRTKDGEKKERVTWHNIQVWGPFADFVMDYVRKGGKLAIEGKISVTEYNNKVYHNIIAEKIELLSPKKEARPPVERDDEPYSDPPAPDDDPPPSGTQHNNPFGGQDDDLPF